MRSVGGVLGESESVGGGVGEVFGGREGVGEGEEGGGGVSESEKCWRSVRRELQGVTRKKRTATDLLVLTRLFGT